MTLPPWDQIAKVVSAFVNADTWAESKQIVKTNSDVLLSEAADKVIANTLAQYRENEDATRRLEVLRALLSRCRQRGIDVAFASYLGPLADAVFAFVNARQSWDKSKRIVEERRDVLLTDAADEVLADLLTQYRGDENATRLLEERRAVLARGRREGIDAAFTPQGALESLLQELSSLTTPGEMPRRIAVCREALALVSRSDQPEQWASLRVALGSSLQQNPREDRAQNIEEAIFCHEQALEVYTREDFPVYWAMAQSNLVAAYQKRIREDRAENHSAENLERTIFHGEQALEVYTREDFPAQWAMVQHALANAYQERIRGVKADNIEEAISRYKLALEVYTRQDFRADWARIQNNLAGAYLQRIREDRAENLERAIHHCEQALEVHLRENSPTDWANTQQHLAIAYQERIREDRAENLERAIHHCEQALEVHTWEDFPVGWAAVQNELANAYMRRIREDRAENQERAISRYDLVLKVYTRQDFPLRWAIAQRNLATAYQERISGVRADNIERAIHHCEQALEVATRQDFPVDWAATQHTLGLTYNWRILGNRAENIKQAIYHWWQALEIRTYTTNPQDCRDTAYVLGNLLYDEHRFAEARIALTIVHEAVEMLRGEIRREGSKLDLAEDNAVVYARLVHCCLLEEDEADAFEHAVAGKGRAFMDMLATARIDLSAAAAKDPELAEDLRQAQELRQQIEKLRSRLGGDDSISTPVGTEHLSLAELAIYRDTLEDQETALLDDMVYKYPHLTATEPAPTLTAEEARALAEELETTLVEYYRHAGGWCAFVVTPDGTRHVPLPNVNDDLLEDMLRWLVWIESEMGRNGLSYESLRGLHEAAIAPLQPYLRPNEKVVLAPFDRLHLLPLGAALDPATGRYVADDYRLAFTPSLAALRVALEQVRRTGAAANQQSAEHLLSVAYPGVWGSDHYLPNVLPEARAIARRFAQPTRLTRNDATAEVVVAHARGQDVVHLGCHGWFDSKAPEQSGLLLSGGSRDAPPQWLTVRRIISELHLDRTRLATVAACRSGLVDVRRGEEHVGLVQALMSAGARAVVAGLWNVNDASTRAFFEAFYTRIQAGDSLADALRDTAREMRSSLGWEHPYYWAAFQVNGLAHGANGSGLARLPDEVVTNTKEAHHESMERTRGGSEMSTTNVVQDSLVLLQQMSWHPKQVLAKLEPAEQVRVTEELRVLAKRATKVRKESDLLALANAVHRLVEKTPALATLLLPPETDVKAAQERRDVILADYHEGEAPEDRYIQEHMDQVPNHVVECYQRYQQTLQEDSEQGNR